MTADLSSVAREAAEREALRQIPVKPMTLHGGITIDVAKLNRDHFIAGFTECASRIPSEREIEIAILGRTATQAAKAVHALIGERLGSPRQLEP